MRDYEEANAIVAEMQRDLGFSTEKWRPDILRWIYRALQSLGVAHSNVISCDQPIEDLAIEKPQDFLAISHIYLGERCIEPSYDEAIVCCPIKRRKSNPRYRVSENRHHFTLGSESKEFEKANLIYYAAPLDKKGLPLVPAYAIRCVKAYVQFQYAQRLRNKHHSGSSQRNPISLGELDRYEQRWLRRQGEARGIQNAPNGPQQAREVGQKIMFTSNSYPKVWDRYRNNIPGSDSVF